LDENPVCNELEESDQDLINYTFCLREKWPVACTSSPNGMKKNRRNQGRRNGNTSNMRTWRLQGIAIIVIVLIFKIFWQYFK
jgi:hypothetical protein